MILLDVVLPDMSGYDICRTVRHGDGINDLWDPDLGIIMLSAKAEHTDRVRGLVRGADDYVTKPHSLPWMIGSCRKFRANSGRKIFRWSMAARPASVRPRGLAPDRSAQTGLYTRSA